MRRSAATQVVVLREGKVLARDRRTDVSALADGRIFRGPPAGGQAARELQAGCSTIPA